MPKNNSLRKNIAGKEFSMEMFIPGYLRTMWGQGYQSLQASNTTASPRPEPFPFLWWETARWRAPSEQGLVLPKILGGGRKSPWDAHVCSMCSAAL